MLHTHTVMLTHILVKYNIRTHPQARTGIKNRPGQFPDDLPPIPTQPGQNCKKFPKSPFSTRKNDHFFTYALPAHPALPKCKHGQSSPPLPIHILGTQGDICAILHVGAYGDWRGRGESKKSLIMVSTFSLFITLY